MAPRQIVILRHAEKPDDPRNPDLSPEGEARAKMLAGLIPRHFPDPDFLFAAARSKYSDRPVETLEPLATALRKKLDDSFADQDYPVLASDLLKQPKFDGKLVIVCWHHGHIPDLALELGVSQEQLESLPELIGMHWNPLVFDRFWSITGFGGTIELATSLQT